MEDEDFYIDCHCHLYDKKFDEDLEEVIAQAKRVGVRAAIVVSENMAQFEKILSLQTRFPDFIAVGLGVHPVQIDGEAMRSASPSLDMADTVSAAIREHSDRLVAIGECGLDFTPYYVKEAADKERQKEVLKRQVDLASSLSLPLNVHSRSAGRNTIQFLAECGAQDVVLHAFDGKASAAQAGVDLGFYFSVPPSILRSKQKRNLVNRVPLDLLLLETDSPCLGPEPQVRNEPKNVTISAEEISKVKGVSVEEVRRKTTLNALRLFPNLKRTLRL